ncbi:polygalacturonase QRT3 [Humulus lupulus]|uniref:polygalacturonase QRT3 n=1 Tax=Humulus lupulus TaxID=3486 RepID=UPI002B416351|nr:polygalacturonase QRT3 [Humulus lupulus]
MGKTKMKKKGLMIWCMAMGLLASFVTAHVHGEKQSPMAAAAHFRKIKVFEASLVQRDSVVPVSSSSLVSPSPSQEASHPRVYHVTSYGADPTGKTDSTDALLEAMSAAFQGQTQGFLMEGIANLGGPRIDLQGGHYLISRPLRFPAAGAGNLMIHGGTLKASDDFPPDGYLIDLSSSSSSSEAQQSNETSVNAELASSTSYNYEYITIKDILLDSNYRGGAISVINSLRTSIDNCYITHFTTNGIQVRQGHETYIRNSFLGQHITAGGDPGERNFSGTAITLDGNDNAVTDVVIFSAATGVMISGQANVLSGVHLYNKATGFGGTGIYLKLPGLAQTRIVNCYLDYTGIVAEDPVQLLVSNSFFLGDAYIVLKSVNGVANGVNIVDNMFSGSGHGVEIVQLDQSKGNFKDIDQVFVDRNNVKGMKLKATVAKGTAQGNGTSWTVDFNGVLLFPNQIRHVQYTLSTSSGGFPNHVLRNSSDNRVVIESNVAIPASVFITVNQVLVQS